MVSSRDIGFAKEKEAARFLKKRGYKIVETNFVCAFGEIDIIAKHKKETVFVEVKYRKDSSAGMPQEAVNKSKQRKIIKSAISYLKRNSLKGGFRFDIVAISGNNFEIIEAAFASDGYFI